MLQNITTVASAPSENIIFIYKMEKTSDDSFPERFSISNLIHWLNEDGDEEDGKHHNNYSYIIIEMIVLRNDSSFVSIDT